MPLACPKGAAIAIAALASIACQEPAQAGRIQFENGTSCYYVSPYFSKSVKATFSLHKNGVRVQGPFTVGRFGRYDKGTGRDGIVQPAPTAPGSYELRVTCDGTLYKVPFASQFDIPFVDVVLPAKTPRITDTGIWKATSPVVSLFQKVRIVPPGTKVQLRFTLRDADAAGVQPTFSVKSIYGTLAQTSVVKTSDTVWEVRYDWTLPSVPGLYDVYMMANDKKGGYAETSIKIAAEGAITVSAITPPATVPAPSDAAGQLDHFLTFFSTKSQANYDGPGPDTAAGSCAYYRDLGFATCNGSDMDPLITFQQWKDGWGFDDPANASKQVRAVYANAVDLGLERDMNAIYSSKGAAFYVCNHPRDDGQLGLDADLVRAINGVTLVACVAMEYSKTPGVNGDKKFTKFLVFDPIGRLARRVNLDGRGIKHTPGACVVCHGAKGTYTQYPTTGGDPALGAHFLPFDLDNFQYSTLSGYTKSSQQTEFRTLNTYVRDRTDATVAVKELINGWYPTSLSSFVGSFVPPGWSTDPNLYKRVVKPACRTCHVNMTTSFNAKSQLDGFAPTVNTYVCGNPGSPERTRYSMPNSKLTFDRFWTSQGGVTGVNQPNTLRDYLRNRLGDSGLDCQPPQ